MKQPVPPKPEFDQCAWTEIEDPADERISAFRSLKDSAPGLAEKQLLVVEGIQPVELLLASGLVVKTLFAEEKYLPELNSLLARYSQAQAKCYRAPRSVMNQLVGFRLHQGILALAVRPHGVELATLALPAVAFCGLIDAENVGAIIRTATAFGVSSYLVDGDSADPFLRRAIRVSMGSVLSAQVCYVESLAQALWELKPRARVICVETGLNTVPIMDASFAENSVFVFGNERRGISEEVLASACQVVSIPIDNSRVRSLNVHAAAAIVLSTARNG